MKPSIEIAPYVSRCNPRIVYVMGDRWSEAIHDEWPENKRRAKTIIRDEIIDKGKAIKRLQERIKRLRSAL